MRKAAFATASVFRSLRRMSGFSETGQPWNGKGKSPLLGFHGERAFALLYNGILGDKTPKGGNVLTRETLGLIREKIAEEEARLRRNADNLRRSVAAVGRDAGAQGHRFQADAL